MHDKHFRLAFDQAPAGVAIIGLDNSLLRVNSLFCSIVGFTADEPMDLACLKDPNLKDLIACVEEAARTADGKPSQSPVEQRYVRRDGRVVWLSISASLIKDEQGLPLHILCLLQDITENKEAADQMGVLSKLLNEVRNSVVVTDPVGTVVYWNRWAEATYGWNASEALGQNVADLNLTLYTDEEIASLWEKVYAGESLEREFFGRRRDGTTFPAITTIAPVLDESGQLAAVGGISLDITKHKQADEALQRSEKRFRTLTEHSLDIIFRYRVAPTYCVEYLSPAVTSILGYTPEEIYADPLLIRKIVHAEDHHLLGSLPDSAPPPRTANAIRCLHKSGRLVWLDWRRVPIYDGAGNLIAFEGISRDVTEQKEVEERLERITRASHDWLWEYDATEGKMWWNQTRREAMGLVEGEEPTTEMWWASIHPEDRERVFTAFQELERDQETSWTIEYRMMVADGTYRTVLDRGSFSYDSTGAVVRSHGALTDISERRFAEETLRQREALLRAVIDTFPFPVWGRDRNGRIFFQNAISRRWWHNQIGTDFDESPLDTDLLTQWKGQYKRALMGEIVQVEAYHTIHDEGRHLHEVIAPILNGGETIGTVRVQMDITKRKRAEEDLRNSEARFRAVWEAAVDAMTLSDLDGTVVLGNPAYYKLHGYTPGQVLGKPFNTIFPEEARAEAMEAYRAMAQMPAHTLETEWPVRRADGSIRTVAAGVSFIEREGQRVLVLSVLRDITEFRQAEEAIRQANETLLEHAERFSTLNRISQVVSTEAYMPSALNKVGKTMADVFRASEVTISLVDGEQSTLTVLTQVRRSGGGSAKREARNAKREDGGRWTVDGGEEKGGGEATIVKGAEGRRSRVADDIVARHALTREHPTVLSTRGTTPTLSEEWERVWSAGAHCLIAMPLRARGNVVGIISISSDEAGRTFNSSEAAWLQTIAGSIASAIETVRLLTQEQQQRVISESLREVVAALASSLDRETVVSTIFDQLRKVVPYSGAGIYQSKGGKLVLTEAAGHATRYVDHKVLLTREGPPQQVHRTRQGVLIETASECPHWHMPDAPKEDMSWMGAPLVAGSKALGVLAVCNCGVERYTHRDLEVLELFSRHAATAFANSLHYEQAHATATDDERNRLARDLHDSVTQGLFSASLIADVLPQLAIHDPGKAAEGLNTLRRLTRGALAEMRALLLELRPGDLQNVRLDVAIGHLATAATLHDSLTVETRLERVPLLPQKVQVALYRIAQEALNNIIKHSQARNVRVELRAEPGVDDSSRAAHRPTTDDRRPTTDNGRPTMEDGGWTTEEGGRGLEEVWRGKVVVEISDDGVGFHPERVEDGQIGLTIMRERARAVKANLRITSIPGEGSKVIASWEDATQRSREQGAVGSYHLSV